MSVIEFRLTSKHRNADMLSRLPSKEVPLASKYETLYQIQIKHLLIHTNRKETRNDPELKTVLDCLTSGKWTTDNHANLRMYGINDNDEEYMGCASPEILRRPNAT